MEWGKDNWQIDSISIDGNMASYNMCNANEQL